MTWKLPIGVALACGACSPAAPEPASVLLVTLDTTRADALGCYGRTPSATPCLDALARESVVFENARTVAPLTAPAHASILTGLYPPRHGVRDNGAGALPESARTLAELARQRGATTAAFVAASVLDRAFRLDQGFEHWEQPERAATPDTLHFESRRAAEMSLSARHWLSKRDRSRPFFAWVHLFDAHVPYEPPSSFLCQAAGDPYLGEIASADNAVGEIVDALREEGALERTLVIVVGDHGEALGEHGEPTHGTFAFDSTLRVPLIVRFPGAARAGERSSAAVSVVDVFATALSALGVAEPADGDGAALDPAGPEPDRGVYFECYAPYLLHGWSPIAGWADAEHKLILSSQPELFLLREDPRESAPIDDGSVLATLSARIAELASRPALTGGADVALDAELTRALGELGYAAAGARPGALPAPHELAGLDLPSPRAKLPDYTALLEASALAGEGRFDEALRAVEPIARANPRDGWALELHGLALMQLDRFAEAKEVLERRAALPFACPADYYNLATCLERLGHARDALAKAREALARDPGWPPALELAARLADSLGGAEEAALYRSRLKPAAR